MPTQAHPRPIRSFPRTCLHCRTKSVVQTQVTHDFEVLHKGQLHNLTVTNVPAERCNSCGNVTFGSDIDTHIDAALHQHLSNTPTNHP
jgi:YgiT-type zinc finger domain-containing protein